MDCGSLLESNLILIVTYIAYIGSRTLFKVAFSIFMKVGLICLDGGIDIVV
jgi:hypothetical protein